MRTSTFRGSSQSSHKAFWGANRWLIATGRCARWLLFEEFAAETFDFSTCIL